MPEISLLGGRKATVQTNLFINNEFVPAKDGATFSTVNPATGEHLLDFAAAGEAVRFATPHVIGNETDCAFDRMLMLLLRPRGKHSRPPGDETLFLELVLHCSTNWRTLS